MPDREPAPFKRALLGLSGGATDGRIVRLACELGKPTASELLAVHVVEVDWTHDLAEDVSSANEEAARILDAAEAIAERHKMRIQTDLLQARDVGAALVDEAAELGADLIVLGLPYRKRFGGDFALGRTVPYVFQNARCEVMVVREAVSEGEQRSPYRTAVAPGRTAR